MASARVGLPCLAAWLVLAVAGITEGAVIYADDFDGLSTSDLHGTAPDTRPGSETWTAATQWKADGSKTANANANAWLPFIPLPGERYHLSLDVNPDISGSSDWFSIGFSNGNATTNWHTSPDQVFGWMLNRENDASTSAVQTFLGADTGGSASHDFTPDKVGPVNLEVVLDTQAANWTVEWYVDGASIRGPEAFATNPTISYAGFGSWNTATGLVDNFLLADESTGPAPPPPFLDEVTVRVQATCDNHYQMFLSESPFLQGSLIGQSGGDVGGDDWRSAEIFDVEMPVGKTFYLHVLGDNDDPPNWGGFIADLQILEHPAYVFDETGTQRVFTDPALWDMSVIGWGISVVDAVSLGTYGVSPWGGNVSPGMSSDTHWLWNAPSGNAADLLYLSVQLTVPAVIPEPMSLSLLAAGLLACAARRRDRS